MPETARILKFPARPETLSPDDAMRSGAAYLSLEGDRSTARLEVLSCPETMLAVCLNLREQVESNAETVRNEASELYRALVNSKLAMGSFDERDYFLGETALLAAISCRLLGERMDSELWLERAEGGFRHTVNPSPLLANVAYQRLALRCEAGRYQDVRELAPMLALSFSKLEMPREMAKCLFLEVVALKETGKHADALTKLELLTTEAAALRDPGLIGLAYVDMAGIHSAADRFAEAAVAYEKALPLLQKANKPAAVAHLKVVVGETLQRQGMLEAAIEAYRASVRDYEALGMATWVAYVRIILAQGLLMAGRLAEADWQILAALPTIEAQGMVPDGFAAVAILRESARQKKADQSALKTLQEHLKTNR